MWKYFLNKSSLSEKFFHYIGFFFIIDGKFLVDQYWNIILKVSEILKHKFNPISIAYSNTKIQINTHIRIYRKTVLFFHSMNTRSTVLWKIGRMFRKYFPEIGCFPTPFSFMHWRFSGKVPKLRCSYFNFTCWLFFTCNNISIKPCVLL